MLRKTSGTNAVQSTLNGRLQGEGSSAGQQWLLNGQEIGPVTGLLRWEPMPGQHTLSLVDHQRRALDTVNFEVRLGLMWVDLPPSQQR